MLVLKLDPDVTERNYAKDPLTKAEVTKIVEVVGSTEPLVNTRHKVAKASGWKEKAPSKTAFVKAVVEDNNVIRRPVLLRGKRWVVGFDEERRQQLLAELDARHDAIEQRYNSYLQNPVVAATDKTDTDN